MTTAAFTLRTSKFHSKPLSSMLPTAIPFINSQRNCARNFLFTPSLLPLQFIRTIVSKSERNKTAVWIGHHKEPLTEQQRLRGRQKHKPFVLGRDNVVQNYQPVVFPPVSLALDKASVGYNVMRTRFGSLPVYTEYKNGRNRILTIIRRVDGNLAQLKTHISHFLPVDTVSIKKPMNHIYIKGNHLKTMRLWLTSVGF